MTVPALLIRINRLYRHNMTAEELYEATRGVWKLGVRCTKAQYAFAIFEGVVREVYEINSWHPAATTPYATRDSAQSRQTNAASFSAMLLRRQSAMRMLVAVSLNNSGRDCRALSCT